MKKCCFYAESAARLERSSFSFFTKKKKAGAEDGLSCPKNSIYQTDSDVVSLFHQLFQELYLSANPDIFVIFQKLENRKFQ